MESSTYPQSTNVSSPIHAASKRRKAQNSLPNQEYRSRMPDFGDDDVSASSDSDAEYFEPVHGGGTLDFARSKEVGPPITSDKQMTEAKVSELHQDVISSFVPEAKKLEEKMRNERGQQKRPFFTERDFREMAINWTTTVEDMLEIRGINTENVKKYGARFLPLIQRYHDTYETMMGHREDRDMDRNHLNVIDLISDDDGDHEEDNMSVEEHPSKYFTSPEVRASNRRPVQAVRRRESQRKRSPSLGPKQTNYRGNRGSSSHGGQPSRGWSRGGYRRSSGGFQKPKAGPKTSSGVSKARASNKRSSNGSIALGKNNSFQQFARKTGGSSTGGNGFGGFDMMPTN
jgi:bloom syndrome protein